MHVWTCHGQITRFPEVHMPSIPLGIQQTNIHTHTHARAFNNLIHQSYLQCINMLVFLFEHFNINSFTFALFML